MTHMAALAGSVTVMFLVIAGFWVLPLRLDFSYERDSQNETAQASLAVGRWPVLADQLLPPPTRAPRAMRPRQPNNSLAGGLVAALRTARRLERGWRRSIAALRRRARFSRVAWHSTVSAGDAASTGLITGYCWAVKACFLGHWQHQLRRALSQLDVQVSPDFTRASAETHFHCIANLRCGHIIRAMGPLLREFWENRGEL